MLEKQWIDFESQQVLAFPPLLPGHLIMRFSRVPLVIVLWYLGLMNRGRALGTLVSTSSLFRLRRALDNTVFQVFTGFVLVFGAVVLSG